MSKPRHKRADGTEIDPVKDLDEFLKVAAPQSDEEVTPAADPQDWRKVKLADAGDEELNGKTGEEAVRIAQERKTAVAAAQQRAEVAERALAAQTQQAQMEETARRVLRESQPRQQQEPEPEDPRIEARKNAFLLGDVDEYNRLTDEMYGERITSASKRAAEEAEQRVMNTLNTKNGRERGEWAYNTAIAHLKSVGVPDEQLNRRNIKAVYTNIVDPSESDYYNNGGPTNPNVIVQAFKDMFGLPNSSGQQAQPTPVVVAPASAAAPTPVAPPGSSKPAQPATPARGKDTTISADARRDAERLGQVFKMDPEKLIARRKARMQAEGDSHA